jgi:L-ascorbate metabolism protein UlaG (beta-lactamase superfamily)
MAMRITWFGQSAFHLVDTGQSVFIDPFGDVSGLAERGITFEYPPITGVEADLVLVTHEHLDHNGVEAIGGSPEVLRSTAGKLDSPLGEVTAVASEHDPEAGTTRGPNAIFGFEFDGIQVCHFGDFGQQALRTEQRAAIGDVDLLFVPIGAGPTIGAEQALAIVEQLGPRWVVPMHYRTPAVDFLEPPDAFLDGFPSERVQRLDSPSFEPGELSAADGPLVVVPHPPL